MNHGDESRELLPKVDPSRQGPGEGEGVPAAPGPVRPTRDREESFALVSVLIFSLLLTVIGLSVVVLSVTEVMISHNDVLQRQAFYVAEGGVENQIAQIDAVSAGSEIPTQDELLSISQIPPAFEGFSFSDYGVSRERDAYLSVITLGPYAGLSAFIQPYRLVSRAVGPGGSMASISRRPEHHLIPVFQFSIFYDLDLEIFPRQYMTVNGRVHTNGNLHVGAETDLYFDGFVTSADNILSDRKDGQPGPSGQVWFKDDRGSYRQMTFDSQDSHWEDRALRTWGGRVQDQAHGIIRIQLPLVPGSDPVEVIRRGEVGDSEALQESRFYYKAGLMIIDGVATDGNGYPVALAAGILSSHTFYNFREGKWLTATEIDIEELIAAGQVPGNGIIYISASETLPGARDAVIRLVNGSRLPQGGLTVATDNPLYIRGNYNVVIPQPASVLADALNILSNSWDDVNSDQSIGHRRASDTTIRAAVMAGTLETTPGNYNGGIENFPRFLEDWGGMSMTYVGSLVCMWISEWATGQFVYGGEYYIAPSRNWSFDSAFYSPDGLPPGTPSVLNFEPGDWSSEE